MNISLRQNSLGDYLGIGLVCGLITVGWERFHLVCPELFILSMDASLQGWGSCCKGSSGFDGWLSEERKYINFWSSELFVTSLCASQICCVINPSCFRWTILLSCSTSTRKVIQELRTSVWRLQSYGKVWLPLTPPFKPFIYQGCWIFRQLGCAGWRALLMSGALT